MLRSFLAARELAPGEEHRVAPRLRVGDAARGAEFAVLDDYMPDLPRASAAARKRSTASSSGSTLVGMPR